MSKIQIMFTRQDGRQTVIDAANFNYQIGEYCEDNFVLYVTPADACPDADLEAVGFFDTEQDAEEAAQSIIDGEDIPYFKYSAIDLLEAAGRLPSFRSALKLQGLSALEYLNDENPCDK